MILSRVGAVRMQQIHTEVREARPRLILLNRLKSRTVSFPYSDPRDYELS